MADALLWIIPIAGIIAILFAIYLARDVLSRDQGTEAMQDVAGTILEGAVAFIRRQYTTIAIIAVLAAVIIGIVITLVETPEVADVPSMAGLPIGIMTAFAFLVGAACSMASGIIGMFVAVKANVRTASAARRSLVEAVQVAMRGGAVSGFLVVSLSLLGVWGIFTLYDTVVGDVTVAQAPFLIVGFGFGASFVALFAQLGGGIYTKAADVGSDLVGKVEKGIPEDDPRNAGVVADLVGDNVGDCAGRGADLFESTAAENIGAMILGVAVYSIAVAAGWPNPEAWIFFPLVDPRVRPPGHDRRDLLRAREGDRGPDEHAQPRVLGHDPAVRDRARLRDLGDDADQRRHRHRRPADVGLLLRGRRRRPRDERGVRLHHPVLHGGLVPPGPRDRRGVQDRPGDQHHQRHGRRLRDDAGDRGDDQHRAVRELLARQPGQPAVRRPGVNVGGIFGTAVATMGMLMTTAYILAMDTFGPITDNAGGIAEF